MRSIMTVTLACLAALALPACGAQGGSQTKRSVGTTSSGSTGSNPTPTAVLLVPQLFGTIAEGAASAITAPEEDLVLDPVAWDGLWNRHTAFTSPAPRVSWTAAAVVAAFGGAKPYPGHRTDVVAMARDAASGDLHATVRELAPGSWGRHIAQVEMPYHLVGTARPAQAGARLVVHRQRLLAFEVLQAGTQSLIGAGNPSYAGELLVFRDLPAFQSFWGTHTTDPMPAVDFASEMVVAVLAGFRGSFGHSVVTSRILYDAPAAEVRVDFRVDGYRGGAPPPQVTETPFQILRVSKAPGSKIRREVRAALPPRDVARGDAAVFQGATAVEVIRDQATLDGVIRSEITGGAPLNPAPVVDFAREDAVIAFLGPRPSSGWPIAVAAVARLEDGEIEILVTTEMPFGAPQATPTSPWHLVAIPKTFCGSTTRIVDVTPRP